METPLEHFGAHQRPNVRHLLAYPAEALELALFAFPKSKDLHQAIGEHKHDALKMLYVRYDNLQEAITSAWMTINRGEELGYPQELLDQNEHHLADAVDRLHAAKKLMELLENTMVGNPTYRDHEIDLKKTH